jgi:hypothetical protein
VPGKRGNRRAEILPNHVPGFPTLADTQRCQANATSLNGRIPRTGGFGSPIF